MANDAYSGEALRIIAANVWALRERTHLSRQLFAEQVGTTRGVIYEIENQIKSPSLEMLEKIAATLSRLLKAEITCASLLTEKKRKEPTEAVG